MASVAQSGFGRLSCTNIESAVGDFSSELPRYLSSVSKIGLAFIDGNHRYGATMDYFKACLEKQDDDSILIFDDINWSKEMARAWKEISSNEKVTVSIDLFRMGIVFFRQGVPKQHFKLKF
ncbi:MAG: class I SAM-dependent methyltransferase [Bacteroidetes bacterium]|nr:class I SAM-dependent methyltransferase [Bacteroidota bacterium]